MYKNLTWFTASDSTAARRSLAHVIIITVSYSSRRLIDEITFSRHLVMYETIAALLFCHHNKTTKFG
jgi:hypothetical protein